MRFLPVVVMLMLLVPMVLADDAADIQATVTRYYDASKAENVDDYLGTLYLDDLSSAELAERTEFIKSVFASRDLVSYELSQVSVTANGDDGVMMYHAKTVFRGKVSKGGTGQVTTEEDLVATLVRSGGWKIVLIEPASYYFYRIQLLMPELQQESIERWNDYVVASAANGDATLTPEARGQIADALPEFADRVGTGASSLGWVGAFFGFLFKAFLWLVVIAVIIVGGYFGYQHIKSKKSKKTSKLDVSKTLSGASKAASQSMASLSKKSGLPSNVKTALVIVGIIVLYFIVRGSSLLTFLLLAGVIYILYRKYWRKK
ncbi:MAG: hypothetical protein AABY13_01585 [Nanoarchaeota archaeon]